MVKLSQIEEYKNRKKTEVFRRAWGLKRTHGGILRGVSSLEARFEAPRHFLEFAWLQGARK